MGEVYRARDPRMGREVAIKLCAERFSDRFEREVRAVSALNHANICHIYDVGANYLVMEMVEGPTLADRIQQGAIPLEEALAIARQIGDALEAAHEKGIVHRDLKPANIKIKPDGAVKVLDFGLAKIEEKAAAAGSPQESPTVAMGATLAGQIMGTAAYMAPEQARGKTVDKRADIWAFGVVLYEMLTGRRLFEGETISDTLAGVLTKEPDWNILPPATPPSIRLLVRRCLRKEREQRLHDIADARIEIDETRAQGPKPEPAASAARYNGRRWIVVVAALSCALLGAAIAWLAIRPTAATQGNAPQIVAVARFTHNPDISQSPTWNPDGSLLAFASNQSGNFEIYVRRVEGGQDINISNDPGEDFQPAFSPDGNSVAFVSTRSSRTGMIKVGATDGTEFRTQGGDVWVVPALGGQSRLLGKDGNFPAWHPSGRKVAYVSGTENHRSIMEVAAEGGNPRALIASESSMWEIVRLQYSPDQRWVTFETWRPEIFILPAGGGSPRKLLEGGTGHVWDPSGKRLYYCTRDPLGGTRLQWVEVDESSGELRGKPQTIALMTGILRELAISHDGQQLAVSEREDSLNLSRLPLTADGGSLAGPEEVLSRGQVFDRAPSVSPDGRSIAYSSNRLGLAELWIFQLDKPLHRLQLPQSHHIVVTGASWFPDGRRLLVIRSSPDGKGSLWIVTADGSQASELTSFEGVPSSEGIPVSPDGLHIVYPAGIGSHTQLFSYETSTRQTRQLTSSADDKLNVCWSPDGRWLVYPSNASGDIQLWRIPAAGGDAQRLTKGSDRIRHMFYSSDGRWLYFQPNHLNIYRMPAQGGAAQQVTHFPESGLFIEEPTISPDNRYLVYTHNNGGSSLWLLRIGTPRSGSK
jgi:serine/threonine-protein kinase